MSLQTASQNVNSLITKIDNSLLLFLIVNHWLKKHHAKATWFSSSQTFKITRIE